MQPGRYWRGKFVPSNVRQKLQVEPEYPVGSAVMVLLRTGWSPATVTHVNRTATRYTVSIDLGCSHMDGYATWDYNLKAA